MASETKAQCEFRFNCALQILIIILLIPNITVCVCVCVCVGAFKISVLIDGVGASDVSHLSRLAQSLANYSRQLAASAATHFDGATHIDGTTQVDSSTARSPTGTQGDWSSDAHVQLTAGNVAALVRGVAGLASARSTFVNTPCPYDEVNVGPILII